MEIFVLGQFLLFAQSEDRLCANSGHFGVELQISSIATSRTLRVLTVLFRSLSSILLSSTYTRCNLLKLGTLGSDFSVNASGVSEKSTY